MCTTEGSDINIGEEGIEAKRFHIKHVLSIKLIHNKIAIYQTTPD